MFACPFLRISALTLALMASSLPAQAGRLVDMEIVNRNSGETLASYPHRGQHFVAGNPGDRYAVRLSNRSDQRVLVVLSVDILALVRLPQVPYSVVGSPGGRGGPGG
jgi:hypothetical protein